MSAKIILTLIYFLLAGLTSIHLAMSKAGIGQKPLAYNNILTDSIHTLGFIGWLIMNIVMWYFFSWKYVLGIGLIALLGNRILFNISEAIIVRPIYNLVVKKLSDKDLS